MESIKSGRWLSKNLSHALQHLPEKTPLITDVFKKCVVLLFAIKAFRCKVTVHKCCWNKFLKLLAVNDDPVFLTKILYNTLSTEMCSTTKPFWSPACKKISEKLDLPNTNKKVFRNHIPSFHKTLFQQKTNKFIDANLPYPEVQKYKTLKIRLYPTQLQKEKINEFINTSRYVYNKTIEKIKKGHKIHFQSLRDELVTYMTKKHHQQYKDALEGINAIRNVNNSKEMKDKNAEMRKIMKGYSYEKNTNIKDWEILTPKDIRSNAVKQACDAWRSAYANFKAGNIRYFNLKYRKKSNNKQTIELTPKNICFQHGEIRILPQLLKHNSIFKISPRNKNKYSDIKITKNCDIVKHKSHYFLHLTVDVESNQHVNKKRIAGVDPGIRTFATVYTHDQNCSKISEYVHRKDLLIKYNDKLDLLKLFRYNPKTLKRIRKSKYNKIERHKTNYVDSLHWDFINDLLKHNDTVIFGDVKSHDIVKNGVLSKLNRDFNDLKFYKLKQRLLYKASVYGKAVNYIKENYTTKTCSTCGMINNNVGIKTVFNCNACGLTTGRDWNAARNMLIKGIS